MRSRGFTMVEILITAAVFVVLGLGTFFLIPKSRRSFAIKEAQTTVVQALEEARNRSITGSGGLPNGVHLEPPNSVTSFVGTYTPGSGTTMLLSPPIVFITPSATIMFGRITGTSSVSTTIILQASTGGGTSSISITNDGTISTK